MVDATRRNRVDCDTNFGDLYGIHTDQGIQVVPDDHGSFEIAAFYLDRSLGFVR